MKVDWHGVFPAATTQFRADESLDITGTIRHLDCMIHGGIHGLIMLGTVGENNSLDYEEKLDVLKATVQHIGGRMPVLTGVAEQTTRQACRFARDAQSIGVNGLMLLPGVGYQSDSRETVHHFRTVADACSLPIMIYNNPVTYGVDLKPAILAEMADEPKFVAVKESSNDVRRITDIRNLVGDRYILFCGVDDLALESIMLGCKGWVSGLVNAFPDENRLLWDLAAAGNWEAARRVYQWYMPLLHLDTHVKLIQYIKLAEQICGVGSEHVRSPRLALVGEERDRVSGIIRTCMENRPQPLAVSG